MDVIERLAVSREDGPFAVVAALVWLFASFVYCPQYTVEFVSKAGVEISAAIPSLESIMVSIEDDDRETQKDDLELCGLPGVWLISPPTLALSQISPSQNVCHSVLTRAQHPLRC
jgi:hypothetical protein